MISFLVFFQDGNQNPTGAEAAPAAPQVSKPSVRLDSYQTESDFVVSVMAKNLKKEEVSVDFGGENVNIIF